MKIGKTKVNLGKTTNRRFYQISYARLIDKLRSLLLLRNKYLMITKESYTSIEFLPSYKVFGYDNGYDTTLYEDLEKLIISAFLLVTSN